MSFAEKVNDRAGNRSEDKDARRVVADDPNDSARVEESPDGSKHTISVGRVFAKSIVGDIFSSSQKEQSFASLAYRSRMIDRADLTNATKHEHVVVEEEEAMAAVEDLVESDSDMDNEFDLLDKMTSNQQLALTLRNWTDIPENDHLIINEGIVSAINALSHMDDPSIRRCCAVAYYHLASREANHHALLQNGVCSGVVTLTMQARSWKVAKMCAMTLCYLTMAEDGEEIMATEGAILALVMLLGIKGHKLLPVCVQALYNLTCSKG
jgi:hypothetical protein